MLFVSRACGAFPVRGPARWVTWAVQSVALGSADKGLVQRGGYPQFGAEGAVDDVGSADKGPVQRGGYPQFGAEGAVDDVGFADKGLVRMGAIRNLAREGR